MIARREILPELMSLLYHLQGNTKAGSDIWISRETIARAEAVSPTLQQLQPAIRFLCGRLVYE